MFKNYFKTAFRSLIRNKSYTAINITGLAVGIAVCLVIFLILQYEMSFDNFHKNKAHIFRVMTKPEKGDITSAVPFPLPTAMKNDFPQLQIAGMFYLPGLQILITDKNGQAEKKFKELWRQVGISADWSKCYSTISDKVKKISQESFIILYKSFKLLYLA